jgi:hypothetical protein
MTGDVTLSGNLRAQQGCAATHLCIHTQPASHEHHTAVQDIDHTVFGWAKEVQTLSICSHLLWSRHVPQLPESSKHLCC